MLNEKVWSDGIILWRDVQCFVLIRFWSRSYWITIIIVSLTRVITSLHLCPLASHTSSDFRCKILEKPKKPGHHQNHRQNPGTTCNMNWWEFGGWQHQLPIGIAWTALAVHPGYTFKPPSNSADA